MFANSNWLEHSFTVSSKWIFIFVFSVINYVFVSLLSVTIIAVCYTELRIDERTVFCKPLMSFAGSILFIYLFIYFLAVCYSFITSCMAGAAAIIQEGIIKMHNSLQNTV